MNAIRLIFTSVILCAFLTAQAQNVKETTGRDHKGFYLSMGLGPVFGNIDIKNNTTGNEILSGTGAVFDLKIGGTLKENLILHGTLISNSLAGPNVKTSSGSAKASNNVTVGEALIGGGLTYYVMPANILLSGSVGIGTFNVVNGDANLNISTQKGFSMQLKVGKEWWVSKRWGLGVAATYGKTSVHNTPGGNVDEKLNSNRFGIMFSASLN